MVDYKKSFFGAVYLKEQYKSFDGDWKYGAVGVCSLVHQKDVGIQKGSSTDTWAIRVENKHNCNDAITFPGCQIRAIRTFTELPKIVNNSLDEI